MTDTGYTVQFLTFGYILYVEDSSLTQLASGIKSIKCMGTFTRVSQILCNIFK